VLPARVGIRARQPRQNIRQADAAVIGPVPDATGKDHGAAEAPRHRRRDVDLLALALQTLGLGVEEPQAGGFLVKRRVRPIVEARRLRGHDLALGIVAEDAEAVVVGDAAACGIEQRQDRPPRLRIRAIDVDQILHRRERQRDAAPAGGCVGLEEQAAEQIHRPVFDHDVGEQRAHQLGRRNI